MSTKANGHYTDGTVDSLKHSGVQPWSAGATFPFIVFKREHYSDAGNMITEEWVVTLAGEELTTRATHDEAEAMAAVFKASGVRDRFDAHWVEMESASTDDEHLVDLNDPFTQRCRHDDRVMYPNGKPEVPTMGTAEWHAQREANYQPYDSKPASGRDKFGWDRELSATMSRARAEFYSEDV